jgi:hypothetical protein
MRKLLCWLFNEHVWRVYAGTILPKERCSEITYVCEQCGRFEKVKVKNKIAYSQFRA